MEENNMFKVQWEMLYHVANFLLISAVKEVLKLPNICQSYERM